MCRFENQHQKMKCCCWFYDRVTRQGLVLQVSKGFGWSATVCSWQKNSEKHCARQGKARSMSFGSLERKMENAKQGE